MRPNTVAGLSLFLCLTAAHLQEPHSQQYASAMTRRERIIRHLGAAWSGVWSPRREIRSRKIGKRSGVNANSQCVLRPPSELIVEEPSSTSPANGTQASSTKTTTTKAGPTASTTKSSTSTGKGSQATANSPYKLKLESAGESFFEDWSFFAREDPTHGTVQYLTKQDALSNKLIEIDDDGYAIMRVDLTPQVTGGRKSVRIETLRTFNGGLWVLDAAHVPTGCGTWPAYWTHGPSWPNDGEIDIFEGVNENTLNQMTLHTAPGCTVAPDSGGTGKLLGGVCGALETGNAGCGIVDNNPTSYGPGYNNIKGGVHAMLWDDSGVSIWFFPRGSIPKDITSEAPLPATWGQPSSHFPSSTCAAYGFNRDHTTIFDTTFCGDWAGAAWTTPPNQGGPSCAEKTGVATCQEYVLNHGASFSDAYWKVKSVKIYQVS